VRSRILAMAAITVGLAIGYVDSRPTWDDTGVTVIALVAGSFFISAAAGRRPWLWAILVGGWIPVLEFGIGRNPASFIALVFAFAGAYAGGAVSRLSRGRRRLASED
jgi:hypothetical protein